MTTRRGEVAEEVVHVLLVEDEEAHAELVRRAFEPFHKRFRLTVAGSIRDAMTALTHAAMDLVLSDWRLPDGHGTDLLPRARAGVPIVVMTSQGDEQTAVEVMKAGALDYVVKSADAFNDLPHVADRALREWRLMLERKRSRDLLELQYACAKVLSQAATTEEAVPVVLEHAAEHTGAIAAELWVPHESGMTRKFFYDQCAPSLPATVHEQLQEGESWLWPLLDGDSPTRVEDVSPSDLRPGLQAPGGDAISVCAAPVALGSERLGALLFFGSKERWSGDADLSPLVAAVAAQLAAFLHRVKLQDDLLERERLAAMGTAAAMFAHEVGNPLNSMYLRAQMLTRQLAKEQASESLSVSVETIVSDVKRLNGLLEEFRSLSRKRPLVLESVDLAGVIRRVVDDDLRGLMTVSIRRELDLPKTLPSVRADRDKLVQIFLNLCKNAVEAMIQGGTLRVTARVDDNNVMVAVSDTGPGLPPGVDVFELFKTTKENGTGLGLPVVRQLVVAHGGRVDVDSVPGQGATFRVTLPLELPDRGR